MQIKWSLYGRVWREIGKPHWKWLAIGVLCITIAAGAEAFSITLVKKIVDKAFVEKNMASLYLIGLQIVGAFTVKGVFNYIKVLTMAKAGLLGATGLRRRIYAHMIQQPMRYFHKTHTGILMNYFTGLANAVLSLVTEQMINVIQNVVTLFMMLGVMFWYAPQMTGVLVFLAPAIVIPLTIITRKRRVVSRRSFGADADSITHITQSLEGIKTIQAFCNEDFEKQNMNTIENTRVKLGFKAAQLAGMQSPLLEIMISIGLCIALVSGGYFIKEGSLSTGDLIAFLLALTAAYKPAKTLTSVSGGIQGGLIAAEGLFTFLDSKPELLEAPDAKELESAPMAVRFDNVSFCYNKADGDVLRDVSLDIKPGEACAFVGPSGGGKSTLFNMLSRFWDPREGVISINGTDIREYTLKSLRGNIANVSQDVFLFKDTIAENIKYGHPGATMAQIEAAAIAANAHEFIVGFPQQYKQLVGERGVMLSGGQKQRIAIARAILKNAPILLLDEATSALDTHSEKLIQAALKELMKGRTTFVIAHRLTTILDSDLICVVKDGRIVERGTDEELTALGGVYKRLKDSQFKNDKAQAQRV
ncbi:MAG: ABC transporter ATP-binding protein/permease [Alphaproteobacteria bacterium]|nr:ABC transporter ATP-binding protein/permease [Alphaproteobacteria bacterium]